MKIKFTKITAPIGYAYGADAVLECNAALGKEFIELGYAIELESDKSTLPEDLPAKDVLIGAGIDSLDALKEIATPEGLIAIKGIGKKLADSIINYLAEL